MTPAEIEPAIFRSVAQHAIPRTKVKRLLFNPLKNASVPTLHSYISTLFYKDKRRVVYGNGVCFEKHVCALCDKKKAAFCNVKAGFKYSRRWANNCLTLAP